MKQSVRKIHGQANAKGYTINIETYIGFEMMSSGEMILPEVIQKQIVKQLQHHIEEALVGLSGLPVVIVTVGG